MARAKWLATSCVGLFFTIAACGSSGTAISSGRGGSVGGSAGAAGTGAGGRGGNAGGGASGSQGSAGSSAGGAGGRGGGEAAGAGGRGGTMASSYDAASDAWYEVGCPATPPADRSSCSLICMNPQGTIPQYGPECVYGNMHCDCMDTGTSGGCPCPAGQTCQAPWPAKWFCSGDGG